jgi:hypothetical protein
MGHASRLRRRLAGPPVLYPATGGVPERSGALVRKALKMLVHPEHYDEYARRHNSIWCEHRSPRTAPGAPSSASSWTLHMASIIIFG